MCHVHLSELQGAECRRRQILCFLRCGFASIVHSGRASFLSPDFFKPGLRGIFHCGNQTGDRFRLARNLRSAICGRQSAVVTWGII